MIISATDLRRRSFTFVSLTSRINASHTTSTNSKSNAESLSHFCSSFALFSNIYEYSTLVVALYASRQRIFQRDSVSSGTRSLRRSSKDIESESSPPKGCFFTFDKAIVFSDFVAFVFLPPDVSVTLSLHCCALFASSSVSGCASRYSAIVSTFICSA